MEVKFVDANTFVSHCKNTYLFSHVSDVSEDRVQMWLTSNKLNLNREITLLIATINSLDLINSIKLMGITIDYSFNWSYHINILAEELSYLICFVVFAQE